VSLKSIKKGLMEFSKSIRSKEASYDAMDAESKTSKMEII
jgi:hypothetical protein